MLLSLINMIQYIAPLTLLIFVNGAPKSIQTPQLDGRIVGGLPANIEEYPYQISLEYSHSHICGGSIISKEFILTAAHCTYSFEPADLSIRAGSSQREHGGDVIGVKEIFVNPNFDINSMDYDISLLRLTRELTLGPAAAPIALIDEDVEVSDGTKFWVTGWGTLNEGGAPSHQLQVVGVPYVNKDACKDDYSGALISDRMICAGSKNGGVDACQGDSGGPLVADGKLTGIVSWGYGCARPQYPGVYASVAHLRDFVTNITNI